MNCPIEAHQEKLMSEAAWGNVSRKAEQAGFNDDGHEYRWHLS